MTWHCPVTTVSRLCVTISIIRFEKLCCSAAAGHTNWIGTNAAFSSPVSLSVSSDDTVVYIIEVTGLVRKLVLSSLAVTLLAGISRWHWVAGIFQKPPRHLADQ
jgi:hypothetical protein